VFAALVRPHPLQHTHCNVLHLDTESLMKGRISPGQPATAGTTPASCLAAAQLRVLGPSAS